MTPRTRNNFIAALVFALIASGGLGYVLFTVTQNDHRLTDQITSLVAQNEQADALFRLQRLAQESVDKRAELESYFLLRESDSIAFLTEVETLAPQIGLTLETESLQQISVDETKWIQFTFAINGERDNVERFVELLEIVPYVSRVQQVQLMENTDGSWSGTVVIQVQLLSYDS